METYCSTTRDRFAALFRALAPPVREPPTNLSQAIQELPEPYLLPCPWTTWLLFALGCYRRQQDWMKRIVRHYLPHAIPPSPEMVEQEQPVTPVLNDKWTWPGNVELECGCGFGLADSRVSSEIITFGLWEKTDGIFFEDTFFRSISAMHPLASVARFRELHPSVLAIWYGIGDLERAGLLEGIFFDERHADMGVAPDAYRLSPAAVWHFPLIERFGQRWEDAQQRLWLAASIGDWLKAHELAERIGADLLAVTGPRAEWQRREREERAQRSIATGTPSEVDQFVVQDLS